MTANKFHIVMTFAADGSGPVTISHKWPSVDEMQQSLTALFDQLRQVEDQLVPLPEEEA